MDLFGQMEMKTLPPLETAASLLGESERVRGLMRSIDASCLWFHRLNERHWRWFKADDGKMVKKYMTLPLEQERRLIALAERIEYLHRLKSAVLMVKQNKNLKG